MNLHEYQAKELLKKHGAPVLPGGLVYKVSEVRQVLETIRSSFDGWDGPWVIKAQIHAGGRGKGRFVGTSLPGVCVVKTPEEAERIVENMLGQVLVTAQTGPSGRRVHKIWIRPALIIKRELYAAALLDRSKAQAVLVLSTEGGIEIEEVARTHPEKVIRHPVDGLRGLQPFEARRLARRLGFSGRLLLQAASAIFAIYKSWECNEAWLVEVNPLAVVHRPDRGAEQVVVLDAKMVLEDNALYRHPDLASLRDPQEESPLEVEATKLGLNYIKLSGNIACLVNGAGLAMATMDIIKLHGVSRPTSLT